MITSSPAIELLDPAVPSAHNAPLAALALADAQSTLKENGSRLNGPGLGAALELLKALEAGLNGNLDPAFYLSSMDPGMGKTLTASKFLRAWKSAGFFPSSSILIGVSRLQEITGYLRNAGLDTEDIAVLTSDDDMNALGVDEADHGTAPVMFTTQQMIQSRTRGRSFAEASEFHYRGKPRVLRIWDESLLPADPITVRVDDLGLLASPLRYSHSAFIKALGGFQRLLWDTAPGSAVTVPEELAALIPPKGTGGEHRELLDTLGRLAGTETALIDIKHGDIRLAGAVRSLPDDFAPAVILDASGRVRTTYDLWERHRGTLRRLPAAVSDYRHLQVNLWQRGSGKVTLADASKRKPIVQAIAEVINKDKDSRWLLVHFKDHPMLDEVSALVEHNAADRVRALTWGMHHGTNEFADDSNVVIIGQLNYGVAEYPALASAASGLPATSIDAATLMQVQWGEFQHHLLQALCRASVRRSTNGIAGACRAYVIASPHGELEVRIDQTFPGCRIVPWEPQEKLMGGKVKAAADYLRLGFSNGEAGKITKKEVRAHLGMTPPNFAQNVVKHPLFKDFIGRQHIHENRNDFEKYASFGAYPGGGWTLEDEEISD